MVRNLEAVRVADKRTRKAFGQFFADQNMVNQGEYIVTVCCTILVVIPM